MTLSHNFSLISVLCVRLCIRDSNLIILVLVVGLCKVMLSCYHFCRKRYENKIMTLRLLLKENQQK